MKFKKLLAAVMAATCVIGTNLTCGQQMAVNAADRSSEYQYVSYVKIDND